LALLGAKLGFRGAGRVLLLTTPLWLLAGTLAGGLGLFCSARRSARKGAGRAVVGLLLNGLFLLSVWRPIVEVLEDVRSGQVGLTEPDGLPVSVPEPQAPIVDEAYRFRLSAPGPGWRLEGAKTVRLRVPRAIAGASKPGTGLFAALVVQPVGEETDVLAFADLLIESSPLSNKRASKPQAFLHQGRPAARLTIEGTLGGMRTSMHYGLVLNGGFAYLLNIGSRQGEQGSAGSEALDGLLTAFELLPGPVRPRSRPWEGRDSRGVGWRVRDGRFESVPDRFAARGGGEWGVVAGTDLIQYNPEATVVLVHEETNTSIMLVTEYVHASDATAVAQATQRRLLASTGGVLPGESLLLSVDGRGIRFDAVDVPSAVPHDGYHAVHIEGDRLHQLMVVVPQVARARARQALPDGLSRLELLDPDQVRALAAELAAEPDPETRVGESFSLRRGRFRHYGLGLEWVKPAGYWQLDREELGGDEVLEASELERGLGLAIRAQPMGQDTPATFHVQTVSGLAGVPAGAVLVPRPDRRLAGLSAKHTTMDVESQGTTFRSEVYTFRRNQIGYVVTLTGIGSSLEASPDHAAAALAGIRFPAGGLVAAEPSDSGVRDHRMGFALDLPGEGWALQSQDGPYPEIGSLYQWSRGDVAVAALASCPNRSGLDPHRFLGWMLERSSETAGTGGGHLGEPEPSELGGLWSNVLRASTPDGRSQVFVALRDLTVYELTVSNGSDDEGVVERIRRGFTFLD